METAMISETIGGVDKTKRYGWSFKDEPGELVYLNKNDLCICDSYQRGINNRHVSKITREWSWLSCGALTVGYRSGRYWVIDGQHRLMAAKRRSDIAKLPCLLFLTESTKQEASKFIESNTGISTVTSYDKYRAYVEAEDKVALAVKEIFDALGVEAKRTANKGRQIKSVGWAMKKASKDLDRFQTIMMVCVELCQDVPIKEKILDGLWYIDERLPGGVSEKRFFDRLKQIGPVLLEAAATRHSAFYVKGGAAVWAAGIMEEVNKGLRKKFSFVLPGVTP
ncbi:DUF6551 family protein [Desulfofustis limnaeus]|uniref:ParB/Sulfiredoxin domain-containing protein n=1 Tax=Desulfofustis limnaeus TaxID=2740163 RepID=A0ABM7WCF1_9BACT|nr:DUF6551 family protein [Desulfofustis limnaeus]BDD88721.1 hypothetical protein DPPLL_30860 [Desulfofustis limnaeus]